MLTSDADRAPRISVIIPAFNEEALLPRLLASIDAARQRFALGADAVEVILADNGSTDSTAAIARAHGAAVVAVEKRMIAAARNGGARLARGPILAFVDADTQVHPETFNVADRLFADGSVCAGATGFRFERSTFALRLTYALLVCITAAIARQLTRDVPTGVFFCRRALFEEVGGYDESRYFAEDVALILALRRAGRRRKLRFVFGTDAPAIFSTRKFDRYGDWHYFTWPWKVLWGALLQRTRFPRAARQYWYEDR